MARLKQNAPKKSERRSASARKMNAIRRQFNQIVLDSNDLSLRTPFPLLVIATYLNRLNFKEFINSRLRWDQAQWKYSPGVLAQLMVIATFIPANKKIALSRIHEAYYGMDLEMLVGESFTIAATF